MLTANVSTVGSCYRSVESSLKHRCAFALKVKGLFMICLLIYSFQ